MDKKILLVLQDKIDRLLLRNSLESLDFTVLEPEFDHPVSNDDEIFELAMIEHDVMVTEFYTGCISGGSILYILQGTLGSDRKAILWSGSTKTIMPEELLFAEIPTEYFHGKLRHIRTVNNISLQVLTEAVREQAEQTDVK
jgi:hypothetical protein